MMLKKIKIGFLLLIMTMLTHTNVCFAAASDEAHQLPVVTFNEKAWMINTDGLDQDTVKMLKYLADGGCAAILNDAQSDLAKGNAAYTHHTYLDALRVMDENGNIHLIDQELYKVNVQPRLNHAYTMYMQWQTDTVHAEIYGDDLLNQRIKELVAQAGITEGMDKHEAIIRIANTVANALTYKDEYVHISSVEGIMNGEGVCVQYATLFQYMCEYCGISCSKVMSQTHVWNVTNINNEILFTDPTFYDSTKNSAYILQLPQKMLQLSGKPAKRNYISETGWGGNL